jgi:hypothetical protein
MTQCQILSEPIVIHSYANTHDAYVFEAYVFDANFSRPSARPFDPAGARLDLKNLGLRANENKAFATGAVTSRGHVK